ncbi:metal-binding protein [Halobiforma lacisalsi AJ5]|uniref:Metal-binding protein n=1 Tax=Natronobacterium lacisalsi AJ5 TaxID=358396 RepID=M0L7V6_NATLA|nr:DUF411 domain-containing protein [Halobiforma lacisalsi]APW97984.1 metal-binding protein [Halobiforma lacisalsi AJ5]EMA28539.1 hypothetical protein C445_17981 [Halobiforma lacisalsi AJ5]
MDGSLTRRRLCSLGAAAAFVGASGCIGGGNGDGDSDGDSDGDEPGTVSAAPVGDDWSWDGSVPVDEVVQHHDPSCGCCSEYVAYLEDNGFDVRVETTDELGAVKTDLSVPAEARSCHTVEFGDYLVEGHVPLQAVEALFAAEPAVAGITIPGMPRHAPGMGLPGDDPLTVYTFEDAESGSDDLSEFVAV